MVKFIQRLGSFVLCGLMLAVFCGSVHAQNPVSLSMTVKPAKARAGDKLTARISASIEAGWNMYSITQGSGGPIPTRITVGEGAFKVAGRAIGTAPTRKMDPNFGIVTETYSRRASFIVPLSVDESAQLGMQTLTVNVRYQACNDTICLPPRTLKLSTPVEVIGGASAAKSPTPAPSPTTTPTLSPTPAQTLEANTDEVSNLEPGATTDPDSDAAAATTGDVVPPPPPTNVAGGLDLSTSLWAFLWAAAFAGALSLLTPCVFPMIPITVSYFTTHSEGRRGRATVNAFIFALGIVFTFTVLGMLLALLFGAAGINKFAASPYVNILIAALFIAFALSLFGAFNLGLPPTFLTKLDSFSRGRESSKILGLLLMGLVFSVTTLTCTAPLLGGLLVLATQGNWFYPALGMLAFSAVFALPFFVLALAPRLLAQLPRSGGWLNSVKVVMGFLEIAAAMKFISNVDLVWGWGIFTREVVLASWVAIAALIAVYLLGKFQLLHDSATERIGALRLVTALIFLSFGFYLLTGLFGARLGELESFLPPRLENARTANSVFASTNNSEVATDELEWITNDYQAALKQAKAENKAVFIDFTGYTCTNCRWMEANMFTRPQVREQLEKYVRVQLYTDGEGEVYEKQQVMQQERFGTVALPLYAVVSSEGVPLATFPGMTRDEKEFLSFLRTGQGKLAPELAMADWFNGRYWTSREGPESLRASQIGKYSGTPINTGLERTKH